MNASADYDEMPEDVLDQAAEELPGATDEAIWERAESIMVARERDARDDYPS